MNTLPLPAHVLRRHIAATWRIGRWYLQLEFRAKRLAWRWLTAGDDSARHALDVFGSAALLVALAPLFLVIALLIKLEDGGPVLFVQYRVGLHGRLFRFLKFRTMCPDAEHRLNEVLARNHHSQGVTFKLRDDPRITRVGRWLRRWSLDELPQLINVFRGEMALVGPRPPVQREVALYTLADRRRLEVKPGITCLWQVSGRATIDFPGQVELDVEYIEKQSLSTDLAILVRTLPAVVSGTGAC